MLYDYDEDGSRSSDEVTMLPIEPVVADPTPPAQPQTASSGAQATHVATEEPPGVAGARTLSPAGGARRVPR